MIGRKTVFMVAVFTLLTSLIFGCAQQSPEEELQAEMDKLSTEEQEELTEDIRDDGEIAGEAYSGIARAVNRIELEKDECRWVCTCPGPASECCEYRCD